MNNNNLILIISFIFLFYIKSFALSPNDSLNLKAYSGAWISYHSPSGLKAYNAAILDAFFSHKFTEPIFIDIAVRATNLIYQPFFEEVCAGYKSNKILLKAGMISKHIGRAAFYKEFSVFNSYIRNSAVWDSYGFGFNFDKFLSFGKVSLLGSINQKENGNACLIFNITKAQKIYQNFLIGIQTQELNTNDNAFVVGDDFYLLLEIFNFHFAAKYMQYQGWGNKTIMPGYEWEILTECKIIPFRFLILSGLLNWQEFNKAYYTNTLKLGADIQWNTFKWLGFYAGGEYLKCLNTKTYCPQLGISVFPNKNILFRIGYESTIVENALINRGIGILWLEY